jgi:hypothetical protein
MPTRRRLDQVLDPEFSADLPSLDLDEVRSRRALAGEVENELSYYRRLLHGRMDLIRFEQRRRTGAETRSLIDCLAEILSDGDSPTPGRTRHTDTDLPVIPDIGRREIDYILGDDVLTRLDEIDDAGLESALTDMAEIEAEISEHRRRVQQVEDVLATELTGRYRAQTSPST